MRSIVRAFVRDVLGKMVTGRIAEFLAKEKKKTRVCTYMGGRMVKRAGGRKRGKGGLDYSVKYSVSPFIHAFVFCHFVDCLNFNVLKGGVS